MKTITSAFTLLLSILFSNVFSQDTYPNGQVKSIGDKKNGVYTEYYENGKLRTKQNYTNGKEQGEYINYSEEETIIEKAFYIDGKLEGEYISYCRAIPNKVYNKSTFKNGKVIENLTCECMNDNCWKSVYEYINDTTLISCFYPNGTLQSKSKYIPYKTAMQGEYDHDGNQVGEYESYFESGNLKEKGSYKDGEKIGEWVYYNEDGSIKEKKKEVILNGSNTQIIKPEIYQHGFFHGKRDFYDDLIPTDYFFIEVLGFLNDKKSNIGKGENFAFDSILILKVFRNGLLLYNGPDRTLDNGPSRAYGGIYNNNYRRERKNYDTLLLEGFINKSVSEIDYKNNDYTLGTKESGAVLKYSILNGQLLESNSYVGNEKEGKQICYYLNGSIRSDETYARKDPKYSSYENGISKLYSVSGQIRMFHKKDYGNNLQYISYFENGIEEWISNHAYPPGSSWAYNTKLNGESIKKDRRGNVIEKYTHSFGKEISPHEYPKNNEIKQIESIEGKGKLTKRFFYNGNIESKYYSDDVSKIEVEYRLDGKIISEETRTDTSESIIKYYKDGITLIKSNRFGNFKKREIDNNQKQWNYSTYQSWYPNGNTMCDFKYIISKNEYSRGVILDGNYLVNYTNGNPRMILNYKKGKLDGEQTYYFQNNKVQLKRVCKNGEVISFTLFDINGKILNEKK